MATYKITRENAIVSNNGRERKGCCVECGCTTSLALGGIRVTTPDQQNGVWMCANHRGTRGLNGYHDENHKKIGSGNANHYTNSIELESMGHSTSARAYLVKNGFLATSDCTVDIEYKSPIYTSLQSMAKMMGGVEFMNNSNDYDFSVNNENCGLHTHFGFDDNRYNFRELSADYETLFKPLASHIENLPSEKLIEIFGSDFRYYASPINYSRPLTHENWINIQHEYSIEIRLPRLNTCDQYMNFVKGFRKIFNQLDVWYFQKHNPIKASQKMLDAFVKYFGC